MCPTLRGGVHPISKPQSQLKTVSVVTRPARLDTQRHYLSTKVVPIYLLTFLRAFKLLGWQELGQATGAQSVTWIRSYDLLTLQHRGFCSLTRSTTTSLKAYKVINSKRKWKVKKNEVQAIQYSISHTSISPSFCTATKPDAMYSRRQMPQKTTVRKYIV